MEESESEKDEGRNIEKESTSGAGGDTEIDQQDPGEEQEAGETEQTKNISYNYVEIIGENPVVEEPKPCPIEEETAPQIEEKEVSVQEQVSDPLTRRTRRRTRSASAIAAATQLSKTIVVFPQEPVEEPERKRNI